MRSLSLNPASLRYCRRLRERRSARDPGPILLEVALNTHCDQSCGHCSISDLGSSPSIFPLELLEGLLLQARGVDFLTVVFVGGEPTFYPHLTEAIRLASRGDFFVSLIGNGANMSEVNLDRWAEAGLSALCLSMHGMHPKTHDSFVGLEGAYRRLMEAFELLQGYPLDVAISVTPTRELLKTGEFDEMIDFISSRGYALNFNLPTLVGRAKGSADFLLSEAELARVFEISKHLKQWSDFYLLGDKRCIAGKNGIYVGVGGEVFPCAFIHVSYGNIARAPLSRILEKMRSDPFFSKEHCRCLVAEDPIFVKDYMGPISESGRDFLTAEAHPLLGAEK